MPMTYQYRCVNKSCPEYSDATFDMTVPVDKRDEQRCVECDRPLARRISLPLIAGSFGVTHEKFDEFWATGDPDVTPDHRDSAPVL